MKTTKEGLAQIQPEPISYSIDQRNPHQTFPMLTAQELYELAATDSFRDRLRAALANQAISHTVFLAAQAAQYGQISPQAAEECSRILHAYAGRAAAELWGGDW